MNPHSTASRRRAFGPSGAAECSHGWSDRRSQIAKPVEAVKTKIRPGRGGGSIVRTNSPPLPGRICLFDYQGFRDQLRFSLHPRLHSVAPPTPGPRSGVPAHNLAQHLQHL